MEELNGGKEWVKRKSKTGEFKLYLTNGFFETPEEPDIDHFHQTHMPGSKLTSSLCLAKI